MILVAEIELKEKGILAQLEKTREVQLRLLDKLCQLEKMLRK